MSNRSFDKERYLKTNANTVAYAGSNRNAKIFHLEVNIKRLFYIISLSAICVC